MFRTYFKVFGTLFLFNSFLLKYLAAYFNHKYMVTLSINMSLIKL